MFSATLRRTLSGILILGQLLPSLALASSVCTTISGDSSGGSGLGSVFSVIGDGKITIHSDDKCSVAFANGSVVNAKAGNYTAPGSTDDKACKDVISGNVVKASGTSASALSLDTYSGSSSDFSITLSNSSQISINGQNFNRNASSTQTVTVSGRAFTIPKIGDTFEVPAGEYGTISSSNQQTFNIAGSSKVKSIEMSGCKASGSTISLAPGSYFIDSISWGDQCSLSVTGSTGTATMNFKNGLKVGQSGACVNFIDCDKMKTLSLASAESLLIYAEQHPERLQFNVYNGDFTASDRTYISAGVYVQNGKASLTAASNFAFAGEILANNIEVTQNNNGVMFYSKPSSMSPSSSTTTTTTVHNDTYSLTQPAIPAIVNVGDYAFRANQRDLLADNKTPGISGHLQAFKVTSDGTLDNSAVIWDSADVIKAMDDTTRRGKMMTLGADGKYVAIASVDAAALGSSTAERILNPNTENGKYLAGRDPDSLIGRPWKTTPIIVGDSVLFAADDGFLYSVKRSSGALNWAWMPRQILPQTADAATLMSTHPWGQIATFSVDGKTYVTGSALSGALHFTLEVSTAGDALSGDTPVWQDYRAGKSSPTYPFGGDAPRMANKTDGTAAGKLAYVVDNKLVIRKIDGSATNADKSLTPTVSSNLFYYSDDEIYFGDRTGQIQLTDSTGTVQENPGKLGLDSTYPVESVTAALVNSSSGNSLYILAQTSHRVSAITRDPAGSWSLAWYTAVGLASTGVTSIDSDLLITAPPEISAGLVLIPVTRKGSGENCTDDTAYIFGPLDLVSGQSSFANVKVSGQAVTDLLHLIGSGPSLGIVRTTVVNGATSTDVLLGTTSRAELPITLTKAKTKTRLNWRELTTYF
ncbi:hypothetical protein [Niveibacterium terrae]|uniref:hypothetical protein n=1 Tax=Niveibacterium terrae TaxID=3373598 RepID=UPI003A9268AE